ncbi:MAG: hypothetical protein ACI8TX_000259 [Hyphomicrobiaceae bacterium]|jgi:hypothetical protein
MRASAGSIRDHMIATRALLFSGVVCVLLAATPAVAELGDCGQVVTGGEFTPKASDALGILKSAVAANTPCPPPAPGLFPICICDVDASGKVTASDALRVLRAAVGFAVTLNCQCPGSTTTLPPTTTTSSTTTSSTTTTSFATTTTTAVPLGMCQHGEIETGSTCTTNTDCPTQVCFGFQFRTCSISRQFCATDDDCLITCSFE